MNLKILFISRATLYTVRGGDTVQVLATADGLRQLGVIVDIRLCNEEISYEEYDLLHFFNIIRPADILLHIRKSRKPFVISTIYVDYSEYEKNHRREPMRTLFRMFSADFIEYLKVIARFVVNGEKLISPEYLLKGHRGSVNYVIRKAKLLLPNSHSEYNRLKAHYKIEHEYEVIPNAIDPGLFTGEKAPKDPKLILCVGRIEGIKNQLNLIRAVKGTDYQLILIGKASPNQQGYYELCKTEAGTNVQFIDAMPQQELLNYYRKAKVHVLASWFETTGLSSLEAAAMGCNVVITDKGDTSEYFENYAYYCDPVSPASIFAAINKAAADPASYSLVEKIFSKYVWSETALKTLKAYQKAGRL